MSVASIVRRVWKHRIPIGAICIVLACAAVCYWRMPVSGTTADGTTTVVLLHAGTGAFSYESDNVLLTFLRRNLPWLVGRYLPDWISLKRCPPRNLAGRHKLQFLFSDHEDLGTGPARGRGLRPRMEFIDSTGYVFRPPADSRSHRMHGYLYLGYDAWPRHDPVVHCRLVNNINGEVVLKFNMKNPDYQPDSPVWSPGPLPATARDDELAVTLRGITIDDLGQATPELTIEPLLPSDRPWKTTAWFEDATGNSGPGLCPMESAWRLRVDAQQGTATPHGFEFFVAPPLELRKRAESVLGRSTKTPRPPESSQGAGNSKVGVRTDQSAS
ncbi:hypothetical protein Pan44_03100 [Caulifigura coniformis]|uniref:Uncharacterized protein n=1 Tax=Caulifigura coniformis TaxID=2527983 RepID=A0A517S847_9PLAN|nr:hypothetical protein [Caulifigura coniformis]QDT52301.1 hypothetical protein Pan44_03100 [Caulifigura coniformis]